MEVRDNFPRWQLLKVKHSSLAERSKSGGVRTARVCLLCFGHLLGLGNAFRQFSQSLCKRYKCKVTNKRDPLLASIHFVQNLQLSPPGPWDAGPSPPELSSLNPSRHPFASNCLHTCVVKAGLLLHFLSRIWHSFFVQDYTNLKKKKLCQILLTYLLFYSYIWHLISFHISFRCTT